MFKECLVSMTQALGYLMWGGAEVYFSYGACCLAAVPPGEPSLYNVICLSCFSFCMFFCILTSFIFFHVQQRPLKINQLHLVWEIFGYNSVNALLPTSKWNAQSSLVWLTHVVAVGNSSVVVWQGTKVFRFDLNHGRPRKWHIVLHQRLRHGLLYQQVYVWHLQQTHT